MAAETKETSDDVLLLPSLTNLCPDNNRRTVSKTFGNFGTCVMLPVLDPERSTTVFYGVKKTCKFVCEWYMSWRPWQKEVLLCSLSAKCSVSQLSSLSTILEPVFHRDFVLRLRGKYPVYIFKNDKSKIQTVNVEENAKECPMESTSPRRNVSGKKRETHAPAIEITEITGLNETHNNDLISPDNLYIDMDSPDYLKSRPWSLTTVIRKNLSRQSMLSASASLLTIADEHETGVSNESPEIPVEKFCHTHTGNTCNKPKKREFFPATRLPAPGNMKANVQKYNKTKAQRQLSDLDAKCYKHAKWWTNGSHNSKKLVAARGAKLWKCFSKQLREINEIMDGWGDHDRVILLSEIIKSSEPAQITFFAQCLIQRLKDRTDVGTLPDRIMLKIFSKLNAQTLCKLSQVSRRWRYLAEDTNLWKNKCSQLGWSKGIKNVILLIERSANNHCVDWKQAYQEIYEIFREKEEVKTETEEERSESERQGTSASYQYTSDLTDQSPAYEIPLKVSLQTLVDNIVSITEDVELMAKVDEQCEDAQDITGGSLELLEGNLFELTEIVVGRRNNVNELALDVRPRKVQANNELDENGVEQYERVTVAVEDVKSVKRVRKIQGHMESIFSLQFDSKRCLTGSADRVLRMWDVRSGKGIRKMYGHTGGIRCVLFDMTKIISGSWDTTIMVWDIVKFNCIGILHGHEGCVSCLKLNSNYLISCSYDKTIRIWDAHTWECLRILRGHEGEVTSLFASGSTILTGSTDSTIKMWNIESGQCLKTLVGHESAVLAVQASRALVISGSEDGKIMFWNIVSGQQEAVIQGHDGACYCLVIWKSHFLSGGGDHIVKEWDISTLTCLRTLQGHKGAVYCVKRNASRIVSSSEDGTVRIWDLEVPVQQIPRHIEGEDKSLLPLSMLEHPEETTGKHDPGALWENGQFVG